MKYRKLDPRFWNDEKVRTLSDDGKLALLFTLSHPHMTALGAMRASLQGLAQELGWSTRRFTNAITPAIKLGMVEHDPDASFIALPRFIKYNPPEGPNSVKAWIAALDAVPECPGKQQVIERSLAYLRSTSPKFRDAISDETRDDIRDAFGDAFTDAKPHPSPIQEQEQEAGTRTGAGAGSSPTPSQAHIPVKSNGDRTHSRKHVNAAWGEDPQPVAEWS